MLGRSWYSKIFITNRILIFVEFKIIFKCDYTALEQLNYMGMNGSNTIYDIHLKLSVM